MPLESIRTLVREDLELTDRFIISQLESNIPLIKEIIEYILSCGGKRIRPLILILSARSLAHNEKKHIDLAAVIELIHTATLLHDDVVDSSTLRRGHKTAHTIWGSDTSVLVGDFLYSRAFQIVVDLKHQPILDIFAKATHYIAEGEILQLVNCNNPDTTEEFYFDIIQRNKLAKRNVDIRVLHYGTISTNLNEAKQTIDIKQGVDTENAKKIVKMIKDQQFKVQAAIQGDQVRVTGKKRDDLQAVIGMLREAKVSIPLQFINFRD